MKLVNIAVCTLLAATLPQAVAQTVFNGDVVQGRQVITKLDVNALSAGSHELFFRTDGQNTAGQHYYLPVTVIKGKQAGKRIMLTAGIHANEMNSYVIAHYVKEKLGTQDISGTVTIVHQLNIPGLIANVREFVPSGPVKVHENLNRQVDIATRNSAGQMYSHSIWNSLLKGNADFAIDLHTANPLTFPLFAYADSANPAIKEMVSLFGVDVAFQSSGGNTVNAVYNRAGVPAFTLETGSRDVFEPELVDRAVEGTLNFLRHAKVIPGAAVLRKPAFEATKFDDVRAEFGGFVVPKVKLLDKVKKGDLMFVQYDAFGHVVMRYTSPNDGIVVQVIQNPMAESGMQLGSVYY